MIKMKNRLLILIFILYANSLLASEIALTKQEKEYLNNNSITYAGDPNWLPFEAFDKNGNYTGIIAEHIKIVEKKLNKKFDKVITKNWLDTLELSKKRGVDIISGDAADVVLSQNYKAIDTYIKNPLVIVTRKEHPYIDDLNHIKDKKIAFGAGGGYSADIFKKYPDIKFLECDTPQSGLLGVKTGQYDAFIGTLAMSDYTIVQMGIEDIKITGQTGIVMNLTLFVDKNKPLLYSIINKSIKTISKAKQHEIISKWRSPKVKNVIDYTLVWQITIVFTVLSLIGLFFTLLLRRSNKKLKQTEQQTHYLSERMKLAFDGSRDGLWDWNLIDNTLYFSPRWKEMLGYKDDELEDSFDTWQSRVHPDDLNQVLGDIESCIDDKEKVFENKHRLQHKEGHWVWIYDRGKVQRDVEGKAIRMIGTHTDLTTEINLSNELSQLNETLETRVKEQVEELDRRHTLMAQQARLASMGEMLSSIAHQWRQPLNRINSNVSVLRSVLRRDPVDHKMLTEQTEMIETNTKYMSDTIEDFANFFHPEKKETVFSLQNVIAKALELIDQRTKNVEINIISDKELELFSFQKEYLQVLLIILNNAIDNFESKVIKEPKIDIIMKEHDGMATLAICDNGGGVDEGDIDRIFDPYYTTKFAKEGAGLGLYMAKMMIENSMHGQLLVKNQNGGACFEIITPPAGEINV
jgi:PAS domain S-box-containing protein